MVAAPPELGVGPPLFDAVAVVTQHQVLSQGAIDQPGVIEQRVASTAQEIGHRRAA